MGAADTITKAYMRENAVFADVFNYIIYKGRRVIAPDSLKELDTTEIALPFGDDAKDEAVQKYRDILKSAVIKQNEKASYVLLGIENQTDIHYAMPVRNLIYDALQYGKQVSDISGRHRKEARAGHDRGEYLSGFYRDDKITPVITLVVHFGADKWDGPLSIHEMMDVEDPDILRLIPDYQVQLIDPARMDSEDLMKFETSFREVIGYIKYSRDSEKLAAFLNENSRVWIERNAAQVIKAITKTPIEISDDEEVINVCEAIEKMMSDNKNLGKAEGKLSAFAELVKDGLLSVKDAAARMNMTEDEFKDAMQKMVK